MYVSTFVLLAMCLYVCVLVCVCWCVLMCVCVCVCVCVHCKKRLIILKLFFGTTCINFNCFNLSDGYFTSHLQI